MQRCTYERLKYHSTLMGVTACSLWRGRWFAAMLWWKTWARRVYFPVLCIQGITAKFHYQVSHSVIVTFLHIVLLISVMVRFTQFYAVCVWFCKANDYKRLARMIPDWFLWHVSSSDGSVVKALVYWSEDHEFRPWHCQATTVEPLKKDLNRPSTADLLGFFT